MYEHDIVSLTLDPQHADTLYAGYYKKVYRSRDGGSYWSWRAINAGLIPGISVLVVNPYYSGDIYTGTSNGLQILQASSDVNADGQVNVADTDYLGRYLSGDHSLEDPHRGDIGIDGKVNILDLILLQVELSDGYPR